MSQTQLVHQRSNTPPTSNTSGAVKIATMAAFSGENAKQSFVIPTLPSTVLTIVVDLVILGLELKLERKLRLDI